MEKVAVLDTSVPIQDPQAWENFGSNIVVVPFRVLGELDGHRKAKGDTAFYARQASRLLDKLKGTGDLSKGVATPGGGVLIVDATSYSPGNQDIHPTTADDSIICTAIKWQRCIRRQAKRQRGQKDRDVIDQIYRRFPFEDVRIVSKDILLRVRASAVGVAAEDYQHDKLVRSESEIYSGTVTIPVAPTHFPSFAELLSQSGPAGITRDEINGLVAMPELFANQCCIFTNDTGKSVLAIHKTDGQTSRFVHVHKPKSGQTGRGVQPRNVGQSFALALLRDPSISFVALSGVAGTGKTLMALLAALEGVESKRYSRIVVYRPNIEMGKEMGFLPGTLEEKFAPWKRPIIDDLELLANGEELGPDETKAKKSLYNIKGMLNQIISIEPINYMQGRTIHNAFIIVDEAQNLAPKAAAMAITRAGKNTKIVFTGDIKQIASDYLDPTTNGLTHVAQGMRNQALVGIVTLTQSERSDLAALATKLL